MTLVTVRETAMHGEMPYFIHFAVRAPWFSNLPYIYLVCMDARKIVNSQMKHSK